MNKVSIIIPVYKDNVNGFEKISLFQCIKILKKYPIIFGCPETLDISIYQEVLPNAKFERFEDKYFIDIFGYNRLMLSYEFYERFLDSEYILIHQLDSYVFKDELEYWCEQGYDYIGAPWFERWHEATSDAIIIGVGNGGFSLRRTKKMIKLIDKFKLYNFYEKLILQLRLKEYFERIIVLNKFSKKLEKLKYYGQNEDSYISDLSKQFKWFKLAPYDEAIRFSFEINPDILFKLNNNKLPFGCHGWMKYKPEFWLKHIN